MTETEFITLVLRMREAQKKYEKSRTQADSQEAQKYERQVDEELERIKAFTSPLSFQPSLI